MTKLEKAVKGLELLKQRLILQADVLGYGYHISDIDNALELLKEQMPGVLTLDEVITAKKLDVWIEHTSESIVQPLILIETEMTDKIQTAYFSPMLVRSIKTYGKTWRCWTARPTDEQRKTVKWDE